VQHLSQRTKRRIFVNVEDKDVSTMRMSDLIATIRIYTGNQAFILRHILRMPMEAFCLKGKFTKTKLPYECQAQFKLINKKSLKSNLKSLNFFTVRSSSI